MDLSSSVKRRRKAVVEGGDYERRFQLYLYPPTEDITLEQFEELAITRQKMLREISNLKEKLSRGDIDREAYDKQMSEKIKLLPLIYPANGLEGKHVEERRRDHISHYILRLAYCKSEEQRKWFLSQEVELLKCRLRDSKPHETDEIISQYKKYLPLEKVDILKPKDLEDPTRDEKLLSREIWDFFNPKDSRCECYKVDFTQVLDLVQRRAVVVKNGHAFFPVTSGNMLVSLICSKYRTLLSQDLVRTVTYMGVVEQDERITPLLHKLKDQYFGNDFSDASSKLGERIRLNQIDSFARESFPPCMRHLHESLKREHHLKHFGRLQYGLFLKSIGMLLEEALAFWREEFTKKMEVDKFEKQYAYNVRHTFGQEGKRANYTAYSCMKIITSNAPTTGDHHGCPFRHWDHTHIQEKMLGYGIPQKQVSKITDYAQSSHYQLACQKYFEIVHALPQTTFSLEHPSQYYYESRRVRGGGVQVGGVKSEPKMETEEMTNEFSDLDDTAIAELTADDMEIG